MTFVWERLADGVFRCRLPFLDVAVGLVYGRAGAMLIDTGTTLTEARADSDPMAWQATLERVIEAGGEGAVFVPGTAPWSTRRSSDATETGCARKCDESQTADVT